MNSMWSRIKRIVTSEYLALVLRLFVGYYFVYASMSKIPLPVQFAELMANYRMLPFPFIKVFALLVPWAELVCGLFIIIGLRTRATALIIMLLYLSFNVLISLNVIIDAPITCGCYDTIGEPVSWKKIGKNTLWFLFTLQVFFYDRLYQLRKGGLLRSRVE
jgi:putative oxidoreductase